MMKQSLFACGIAAVFLLAGHGALARQAPITDGPYMVFFDWGKPDINRDAETILDQVSTIHRSKPSARIQLTGHSDRSGTAMSNRISARKRAEEVRKYLAANGVPANLMTVESAGEERPIVATEDGVREVQNRRVEIRFGH